MNSEQEYRAWTEQKKQIEVSPHFPKKLINRVHQFERAKRKRLFDVEQIFEWLSERPLAKAGLAVAAAVLGFIRFVAIICAALGTRR